MNLATLLLSLAIVYAFYLVCMKAIPVISEIHARYTQVQLHRIDAQRSQPVAPEKKEPLALPPGESNVNTSPEEPPAQEESTPTPESTPA